MGLACSKILTSGRDSQAPVRGSTFLSLALLALASQEYMLQAELTSNVLKTGVVRCCVGSCNNAIPVDTALTLRKLPITYVGACVGDVGRANLSLWGGVSVGCCPIAVCALPFRGSFHLALSLAPALKDWEESGP